jgi:hypothetical protein
MIKARLKGEDRINDTIITLPAVPRRGDFIFVDYKYQVETVMFYSKSDIVTLELLPVLH